MTAAEFKNEFDIAYNNIMSNAAPPVNDYEVSVFLTKAQEELDKSTYLGRPNMFKSSDLNEDSREFLNPLIRQYSQSNPVQEDAYNNFKIFKFAMPEDLLYIQQESVKLDTESPCLANKSLLVIPTTLDKLHKLLENPFKRPDNTKAFRIAWFKTEPGIYIAHSNTIKTYSMIYIKKPAPIILSDISIYGTTVDGFSSPLTPVCELHEGTHREIINRAVELAKSAYLGDLNTAIALNSRNQ